MRLRIFIFACVFVAHCGYSQSLNVASNFAQNRSQTWLFPAFSSVNIAGNFNVQLHTGYANTAVTLSGSPAALDNVQVGVVDGVLSLSLKKPSLPCGTVTANIRSRYLNGLVYHGKGNISGDHLRANLERAVIDNQGSTVLSGTVLLGYLEVLGGGDTQISGVTSRRLHVKISGDSKLRLTGIAALKRLDMKGKSWFSLSWEKSPTLIVRACDKAYIEIAGIVNKLDGEIWNSVQLNTRYLRARRVYMKTHDYSVAQISATHHQHTLAMDASDIRFYNLPEMKTDFMVFDGAVLDMRAFDTAFVEEPTPYNK